MANHNSEKAEKPSARVIGIIPARYASTRFPGKPLAMIKGKSMIQRVYEQVKQARFLHDVIVATDDERIYSHVREAGGQVLMTSPNHKSGTERCCEVITQLEESGIPSDYIINIQGDEPIIAPAQIDKLADCLIEKDCGLATLINQIKHKEDLFNSNIVKVVIDEQQRALYFSRSVVPYLQNIPREEWLNKHVFYRHIGLYGYAANTLKEITALPMSPLEKAESLEQLRWLENAYAIYTEITESENIDINTPEDLSKLINKI